MKKFLSILIVAIMLFTMIPTTAFAASATAPKITATADKTTVAVGDTVTVTVKVPANSNLVAFTYFLNYDSSYFQVVSQKTTGVFSYELTDKATAGTFKYIGTTSDVVTDAGTLFTVQFKVLKTGGKITCDVREAYVLSGNDDVNVTSSCASISTKSLTFKASTPAIIDYFEIQTPSTKSISYKNGIVLHVNQKKSIPSTAEYRWSADNENFKMTVSADGKSCEIISNASGDTTFTVELVSATGIVLDSDTVVMTSKAGFFDKIIAFFRSIFGGAKILPE